jgi:hypothetical protein
LVVGVVVVFVGVVVVVVGVVVVVVVVVVDPGVVVEVDVGEVVVVVVVVVLVVVTVHVGLGVTRVTAAGSASVGIGLSPASSAPFVGEASVVRILKISAVPLLKSACTHARGTTVAVVVVPAVRVSPDATGIAHSPSPTRNVERVKSAARRRRRPVIVSVGSSTSASAIPERGGDPPRSHPGPGNYLPLRRFAMWNRIPGDRGACCPDVIVGGAILPGSSGQRSGLARERSLSASS